MTGGFTGSMGFGGPLLVANGGDGFVAKLDSQGNHVWSRGFGGSTGVDAGTGLAVDLNGNLLLTGNALGQVDFGAGTMPCGNTQNAFIAKYSPQGALAFALCLGDGGSGYRRVAADPNGSILMAGSYDGTLLFGPTLLSGHNDAFAAKLDGAGNAVWAKSFGDNDVAYYQEIHDLAVDPAGDVLVVGQFQNGLNMGGGALPAPGSRNVVLAKLSSAGQHVWSKAYGALGNYDAGGNGVAVDPSSNVLVTGFFQGSVDFGGGAIANPGGSDVFLLKVGPSGNHLSSQTFGDLGEQMGAGCAFDATGSRLVVGTYKGSLDFGQGPLPSAIGNLTGVFAAKLTP